MVSLDPRIGAGAVVWMMLLAAAGIDRARAAGEGDDVPKRPPFVHVDAVPFDGHWYLWVDDPVPFETALARARKMKGRLLMIESEAENAFVRDHTRIPTWLGAKRARNRQWLDQDGQVVFGYSHWAPGQPQGAAGEVYVAVHPDGLWHDYLPAKLGYCVEWRGPGKD